MTEKGRRRYHTLHLSHGRKEPWSVSQAVLHHPHPLVTTATMRNGGWVQTSRENLVNQDSVNTVSSQIDLGPLFLSREDESKRASILNCARPLCLWVCLLTTVGLRWNRTPKCIEKLQQNPPMNRKKSEDLPPSKDRKNSPELANGKALRLAPTPGPRLFLPPVKPRVIEPQVLCQGVSFHQGVHLIRVTNQQNHLLVSEGGPDPKSVWIRRLRVCLRQAR